MRTLLLFLLTASLAVADPPTVKLPAEVKGQPSFFIPIVAETDGKVVQWVPITPGLSVLPAGFLANPKTTAAVAGKPGRYTLLAYTGTADGPSAPAYTTIVVAVPGEPPPVDPPNPPSPVKSLYFVIIRPNGPAQSAMTTFLSDPAWGTLQAKGHVYKDLTLNEANALAITLPAGTALPCIVTLRTKADGVHSEVIRGPIALPTTSDGIAKLPEGI